MAYDYVIVGGGSGGATLAARLSEDPTVSVCLLEAGGSGTHLLIRMPAAVVAMLPGHGKISNWAYKTVPQKGLNGRLGYQPRGKALGGSSAINAMLYVRGQRTVLRRCMAGQGRYKSRTRSLHARSPALLSTRPRVCSTAKLLISTVEITKASGCSR